VFGRVQAARANATKNPRTRFMRATKDRHAPVANGSFVTHPKKTARRRKFRSLDLNPFCHGAPSLSVTATLLLRGAED